MFVGTLRGFLGCGAGASEALALVRTPLCKFLNLILELLCLPGQTVANPARALAPVQVRAQAPARPRLVDAFWETLLLLLRMGRSSRPKI